MYEALLAHVMECRNLPAAWAGSIVADWLADNPTLAAMGDVEACAIALCEDYSDELFDHDIDRVCGLLFS